MTISKWPLLITRRCLFASIAPWNQYTNSRHQRSAFLTRLQSFSVPSFTWLLWIFIWTIIRNSTIDRSIIIRLWLLWIYMLWTKWLFLGMKVILWRPFPFIPVIVHRSIIPITLGVASLSRLSGRVSSVKGVYYPPYRIALSLEFLFFLLHLSHQRLRRK